MNHSRNSFLKYPMVSFSASFRPQSSACSYAEQKNILFHYTISNSNQTEKQKKGHPPVWAIFICRAKIRTAKIMFILF
jgi:hypothetical protein